MKDSFVVRLWFRQRKKSQEKISSYLDSVLLVDFFIYSSGIHIFVYQMLEYKMLTDTLPAKPAGVLQ